MICTPDGQQVNEALQASLIDYVKAPYAYSLFCQRVGLSLSRARMQLPLVAKRQAQSHVSSIAPASHTPRRPPSTEKNVSGDRQVPDFGRALIKASGQCFGMVGKRHD